MWSVYIIQSTVDGYKYRGMSENVEERLKSHNRGKVKSTNGHRPFKLIYEEKVESREAARNREKYLKSAAGRKFIQKIIGDLV
ncbi:MAG: GIY-YIG nuclease family protein [Candidatus Marinimicrobia bacterium]|nr:GIY-YIG nuclease family protein [Bacteroidota bacterium]MBL7014515.1 GIY-YIG nuclease family protein [Candidatus Neomarinimicrobiota bacterium]